MRKIYRDSRIMAIRKPHLCTRILRQTACMAIDDQYALYIHSPLGPLISQYPSSNSTINPNTTIPSSLRDGSGNRDNERENGDIEHMGLGIKQVTWIPGGRAIVLGGWDGKVRVVDPASGRGLSTLQSGRKVGKEVVSLHSDFCICWGDWAGQFS